MPSILIDFGDRRDVFDVSDRAVVWQKVVEVDVGEAPKVDVFFKSGNQEVHVKLFVLPKIKKKRRVAVTVAVNASDIVTAKCVVLRDPATNSNGSNKEGKIVTLDLGAMATAFNRTNGLNLSPMMCDPLVVRNGATGEELDAAAVAAASKVPPAQAAAVFIVPYAATWQYATRKRMVEALEAADYRNVRCAEQMSLQMSTALKVAKANKQVGELLGIGKPGDIHVIRKTDSGFDYVQGFKGIEPLREQFPTIKEFICYSLCELKRGQQKKIKKRYHPLIVKFVTVGGMYLAPYMWNKLDGGNMDGYLVTMTVQCKFRINYNGENTVLDARAEMLPWQKTVEVNIGEAETIDVFMTQDEADHGEVLVKQFQFKTTMSRTVSISIAIDDARLPEVKMAVL